MNRNWLEMVFPAALALLVVTIGVFVLSMTGLLQEPSSRPESDLSECSGPIPTSDTTLSSAPDLPPGLDGATVAAGDALFKGNCAQCHGINDVIVGPALAGITKCRPVSWLIPWMKNSSKVVASSDEYAVKIYNQYQKQQMPSFQLSDEEVRQILAYIQSEEGRMTVLAGPVVARL